MDSEELEALRRKAESDDCTILERHNIQMYVAIQLDKDVLKRIIEKESKQYKKIAAQK